MMGLCSQTHHEHLMADARKVRVATLDAARETPPADPKEPQSVANVGRSDDLAGLREAAQAVVNAWDHGHGERKGSTYLALPTEAEMDALRASLGTASDTIDRQGWALDEAQELLRDALHALENCIDPKNRSHVSVTVGALRAALAASPSTPKEPTDA